MVHELFSKYTLTVMSLLLAVGSAAFARNPDIARSASRPPLSKTVVVATYGRLPLSFEANQGQTDNKVKFSSRGPGYALFLMPTEAVLSLNRAKASQIKEASLVPTVFEPERKSRDEQSTVLHIRLEHANGNAKVSGIDELPGKSTRLQTARTNQRHPNG